MPNYLGAGARRDAKPEHDTAAVALLAVSPLPDQWATACVSTSLESHAIPPCHSQDRRTTIQCLPLPESSPGHLFPPGAPFH